MMTRPRPNSFGSRPTILVRIKHMESKIGSLNGGEPVLLSAEIASWINLLEGWIAQFKRRPL